MFIPRQDEDSALETTTQVDETQDQPESSPTASPNVVTKHEVVTQFQTENAVLTQTTTAAIEATADPGTSTEQAEAQTTSSIGLFESASTVPSTVQTLGLPSSSVSSTSSSLKSLPSATSEASASGASSKTLSEGAITAIVISSVLVALALMALAFNVYRRRQDAKHARTHSDARSTIMWDKPPRPLMHGPSISLKPKPFVPPSHSFMQPAPVDPLSPSADSIASHSRSMQEDVVSPFADPSEDDHGTSSRSNNDGIQNPFSDPYSRHSGGGYHGAMAL